MSPFWHHPEQSPAPLVRGQSDNRWSIGAIVAVQDSQNANTEALEALTGGCNAPLFQLSSGKHTDVHRLLAGIDARYISLHFELKGASSQSLWTQLEAWAQAHNLDGTELRGSIAAPPSPILTAALLENWPQVRSLSVDARPWLDPARSPVEELARCLQQAVDLLSSMETSGLSLTQLNKQLFFRLAIGPRYFLDLAKLRALRILWANVLAAYQLPEASLPPIHAYVALDTRASMETNMIRSGTQAMAAAIGGADLILVPPASSDPEKTSFTQRIARNVQHLLQMEAKFDWVVDPAAGSYFLEKLTDELCERAWSRFVELQ
ncbi:MAG: hypothetical protein D6772_14675 [Bacteroidetes bacterium]|nr:MAG: hypothetical protein D6772_14675 [Bacteroidota bacterium]